MKTLVEEGSWKRVKLASIDAGLPDDVLSSSLRSRMKCFKWLTSALWIVTNQQRSRISIQTVTDCIYFLAKKSERPVGDGKDGQWMEEVKIQIYQEECLRCCVTVWK